MQAHRNPTGFVRRVDGKRGPVFLAQLRLPDGSRPQRKLGRAWLKRSRPPAGYITLQQAKAKLEAMLAELVVAAPGAPGVTFGQAVDEWLRYVEYDKQRALSTVRDYRNVVKVHLRPRFGESTPIDSITTDDIDSFRDDLLAREELSRRMAQKVLTLLSGVFARAKRKKWIATNPAEDAEKVSVRPPAEFNVLEPEQVAAIGRSASDGTLAALFTVGAFTGLRCPGELTALRWRDVDFANRIVHVRRNFVLGAEGVPKGKQARSIPMSANALVPLDGLSQREHFTGPDDLVFCDAVGERLSGDTIRDQFYAALEGAGFGHLRDKEDPIVPYDLRHTFGTLVVRKASLSDVQAWMGHKDIATTMRYAHYVPQHDAAARLDAAFASGDPDAVGTTHPTTHPTPEFKGA